MTTGKKTEELSKKYKDTGFEQLVKQIRKQVEKEVRQESKGKKEQVREQVIETGFLQCLDGRLAESAYDPKREPPTYFLIWDGKKVTESNEIKEGKKIKKTYRPLPESLVKNEAVLLPSKVESYESERALLEEIKDFIHARINIPESYEVLLVQYTLFTYIYDRFDALPYIRALGPPGSGKSTLINNVMAHLVYRGQRAAGALTPASLYRTLDTVRGTLIIDEMDLSRSDQSSDIIKVLNLGFQRGSPVYRCDRDERDRIVSTNFYIFGPKLLATRSRFRDDALESRCITLYMYKPKRADNPYQSLNATAKRQAQSIRNKLLLWRFNNYKENWELTENLEIKGVESRINQIMLPLITLTKDTIRRKDLIEAAKELQEQLIEQRSITTGSEVFGTIIAQMRKVLLERALYPTWQDKIEALTMKEIAEQYNVDKSTAKEKITPRKVGWCIQNWLRLRTEKHPSSRRWHIAVSKKTDYAKLQSLIKRYGEDESVVLDFVCQLPIKYRP